MYKIKKSVYILLWIVVTENIN